MTWFLVDEILCEPSCRTAALRPFFSLVLAILTAYYYALLTKTLTTLRSLRTVVLDIIFWETWGPNGKVKANCIFQPIQIVRNSFCLDSNLLRLNPHRSPLQILRRIPGPWALPVIGAQWLYYPLLGKYKYSKYHEANDEKMEEYGPVVREEVIWNFPLIHLFDSKVSE